MLWDSVRLLLRCIYWSAQTTTLGSIFRNIRFLNEVKISLVLDLKQIPTVICDALVFSAWYNGLFLSSQLCPMFMWTTCDTFKNKINYWPSYFKVSREDSVLYDWKRNTCLAELHHYRPRLLIVLVLQHL